MAKLTCRPSKASASQRRAEVQRAAREQLRAYETVEYRRLAARPARDLPAGGFEVDLEDGTDVAARRLLLPHGMRYPAYRIIDNTPRGY